MHSPPEERPGATRSGRAARATWRERDARRLWRLEWRSRRMARPRLPGNGHIRVWRKCRRGERVRGHAPHSFSRHRHSLRCLLLLVIRGLVEESRSNEGPSERAGGVLPLARVLRAEYRKRLHGHSETQLALSPKLR